MKKFGQYLKEAEEVEKKLTDAPEDEQDPYTGKIHKAEDSNDDKSKERDNHYADLKTGANTIKEIINLPYEQFIQKLTGKTPPTKGTEVAKIDPKVTKVLSLGKSDLQLQDEKVPTNDKANLPVKGLFPTQAQIGLLDSIGFLAFKMPENAKNALSGQAEFQGERILTANGKYILDGHHRWSQTYLINPDAKIPALDLTLNVKSEKEMLKVIQMAIASTYGAIAMKAANAATDIYNDDVITKWNAEYKIEGDTALGLVKAVLDGKCGTLQDDGGDIKNVDKFIEVIKEAKGLENREDVEKYLAKNADQLRRTTKSASEGAPVRSIMPQPGDTAKALGKGGEPKIAGIPADFVNKLKSGELNYKPNFLANEKITQKRWVKTFEQFKKK